MRNPYKRLLEILPQRPLQVGTVSASAAGVVTITLPGGGVIKARGDQSVGVKVFVRDGAVEGVAPSLTFVTAEV
jgi:hypothetical protein